MNFYANLKKYRCQNVRASLSQRSINSTKLWGSFIWSFLCINKKPPLCRFFNPIQLEIHQNISPNYHSAVGEYLRTHNQQYPHQLYADRRNIEAYQSLPFQLRHRKHTLLNKYPLPPPLLKQKKLPRKKILQESEVDQTNNKNLINPSNPFIRIVNNPCIR